MSKLPKDVKARLDALKNGTNPNSPDQSPGASGQSKGRGRGPTQARILKTHQNRGGG
mgnify:CR=1 FL=1